MSRRPAPPEPATTTAPAGRVWASLPASVLATLAAIAAVTIMATSPRTHAEDAVTIYRCVDRAGHLTLSDSPCPRGARQEVRTMIRPKDAPPRADTPTHAPALATATPAPAQVIVRYPPRPLYECTTPDRQQYLSDSGEGNPRLVPAWTLDMPVLARVPVYEPGGLDIRVDDGHVSGRYQSGGVREVIVPTFAGQGGGVWIRDTCHPLPQAEVCARLTDRRDTIRRRFTIAQPSERADLGREERGINARLAEDCH